MIKLGDTRLLRDEKFPHMVRVESSGGRVEMISIECLIGALIAIRDGWKNFDPMTGYVESITGAKMGVHEFLPEGLCKTLV